VREVSVQRETHRNGTGFANEAGFFPLLSVLCFALLVLCCQPHSPSSEPGRFTIAVPYDPDTLDPHHWDTVSGIAIASHFYEGIVAVGPNFKIHPQLADSWETPDAIQKAYSWQPRYDSLIIASAVVAPGPRVGSK
jgi:ABC-type transport system substrate-binding protein